EQWSVSLRFPDERLANFVVSFGAADENFYSVMGAKGSLCLSPSYEFSEPLTLEIATGEKTTKKTFKKRDQVAAEIEYFANCVASGREPEPSGWEGLRDVQIVEG